MDIRYQPGQPVNVNVLFPRESLTGHILDLSSQHAAIRLDQPVAAGASLRLDFEDSIVWGEARSSKQMSEGIQVEFVVRDAVPMLSDLGRLVSAVMQHRAPSASPLNKTNPTEQSNPVKK
jgi:hypothetical protein